MRREKPQAHGHMAMAWKQGTIEIEDICIDWSYPLDLAEKPFDSWTSYMFSNVSRAAWNCWRDLEQQAWEAPPTNQAWLATL